MLMPRGLCRPRRRIRMVDFRVEKDFLGEVKVPKDAYWGVQTQRAIENFPISGIRFGRRFIYALGLIKMACAQTNVELGLLDAKIGKATVQACQEVMDGKLDAQFPLDIFQTGSGTSTNMNANEVIANRANEILGHPLGEKGPVHPNDHVNMGQSSNDVIPTAIHVAALLELDQSLLPALRELEDSLARKAKDFDPIVKAGRTHLMDATPIRLGQEFSGYQSQIDHGIRRVSAARAALQPGSSIMPGKVNPVIPEAVMQVGVTVIGNDVAIAVANTHSNLDLSTMMPVMSQRIQQNVELLANVARVFAHKCIDGITANVDVLKPVGDKRGITRVSAVVVSGPRPASPRLRGGIPGRGRFLIGLAGRSKLSPAFVRPPAPWKGGSLL